MPSRPGTAVHDLGRRRPVGIDFNATYPPVPPIAATNLPNRPKSANRLRIDGQRAHDWPLSPKSGRDAPKIRTGGPRLKIALAPIHRAY